MRFCAKKLVALRYVAGIVSTFRRVGRGDRCVRYSEITMAQTRIPQRWDGENQAYFVTVVTKGREPIFVDEANCRRLMTACKEVFAYHPFRLVALVILPDHWHGILRPYPNIVIETVVGAIKQNVWRQMCATQKRSSCWQPRFLDHRIRNDDDLAHHLEYMRQNPVKHGS